MNQKIWRESAVFRVNGKRLGVDAFALTEVAPIRRPAVVLEPWTQAWTGPVAPWRALAWRGQRAPIWSARGLDAATPALESVALVIARADARMALAVESFEGTLWTRDIDGALARGLAGLNGRGQEDEDGGLLVGVDAQELFETLWPQHLPASQALAQSHALIADGRGWAREAMARAAASLGARVTTAARADQALQAARENPPAWVWLDEDLPEGAQGAWARLSLALQGARVGFYSARRGRANKDMARRLGALAVDGVGAMAVEALVNGEGA